MEKKSWIERNASHILLGILFLIILSFYWIPRFTNTISTFWILIFLLLVFFVILGYWINKAPLGILIDNRNKVSLSRLQLVVWTIIILSGFLTMAMYNVANPVEGKWALSIAIPKEMWWLMGISITSLVGSPLIKRVRDGEAVKKLTQDEIDELDGLRRHLMISDAEYRSRLVGKTSIIKTNDEVGKASFWDIFKGEEVSNFNYVDIAKLQMFLFTVVIVIAYLSELSGWIGGTDLNATYEFPGLDPGLVALLGISHTGYLASKGVSK